MAESNRLMMIDGLCTLCEEQARIIMAMALRLGELGDTALTDELKAADRLYRRIIGDEDITGTTRLFGKEEGRNG